MGSYMVVFKVLYLIAENTEKDRKLTPSTVSFDVYHDSIYVVRVSPSV